MRAALDSPPASSGGGAGGTSGGGGGGASPLPLGLRVWSRAALDEGALAEWGAVKRCVCAVMADYEGRVNGSVLREYDSLVAWDFRAVDAEWAQVQARYLAEDLAKAIGEGGGDGSFSGASAAASCAVTLRKTRVEVSLRCINKGSLCSDLLAHIERSGCSEGAGAGADATAPIDFVLCIGDDATDELTFEAAEAWAGARAGRAALFTSTVGKKAASSASYLCEDVCGVHEALVHLAAQLE